jgi:hypothetical protein
MTEVVGAREFLVEHGAASCISAIILAYLLFFIGVTEDNDVAVTGRP